MPSPSVHLEAKTLKNVTLETGGKSPLLVFEDADLDQAVKWSHFGIMSNQGQIFQESVYDRFLESFLDTVQTVSQVGYQWNTKTYQGLLVSEAQYKRVLDFIAIGRNEGATVAAGGSPLSIGDKGFWIAPTVFTDVIPSMRIDRKEIFGAVVVILRFKTGEEAIALANGSTFGLGSAVFTTALERSHRVAEVIEGGMVWINSSQD